MTAFTTSAPATSNAPTEGDERRWHLLSIATLVVASGAAVLSLVAVADTGADVAPPPPPVAATLERSPVEPAAVQTPARAAVTAKVDANATGRYRTVDACGRPIIAGRQSCD